MRIRKNASKFLLGSASSLYSNPYPSPPPPPSITAAAAGADEGLVKCELNCSPWDVMVINPCCNFFTNPKGEEYGGILGNFIKTEEEVDRGILGNLIKTEEEEPISAITSTAGELTTITATTQICEEKVKKIERKKKHKREEKAAAAEMMITTYCKKSDGKGWHCKRHAQLPHTLCSYHLAQIRSYSSNHSKATDASTSAANDGKNHKIKAVAAAAAGGVDSNLYYYYDGFGPWRGKRRGRGRGGADIVNAKMKKEDKQDSSRESTVDFDDDVVAGDDEYDLDNCFDEDDDDDNFSMHQELEEIKGKKEGSDQEEKKRVEEVKKKKKRGRKPIKARSLKSLL